MEVINMGIGKTLTGIILAGAIGTGGYFIGKGAGQDKEYGIRRDDAGVYMEAKTAGKLYEIETLEGQPYLKNNSDFQTSLPETNWKRKLLENKS
jgi:hypothetical protein